MKFKIFFSISFAFLCTINSLGQQKQWRLNECVDYALENNLQVQQSELQAEISGNNNEQAKWSYLPSVSGGANYGLNSGLNIDPVTNQIATINRQTIFTNLSANWVVYDGGRKYNSIAQNNYNYLASLYDLEGIRNDIRLNVASSFLQILLNKEIYQVAIEQENITLLQVNRMQKLVDAGATAKGDLLQLEAQLARDRQNVVAAENSVIISKLQLGNLLQLENPSDFDIIDPKLGAPEASLLARGPEAIVQVALEKQPAIKGAESRVKSSEEGIDMSRSLYLPTVSFTGQISTSYSDQFKQFVPTGQSGPIPIGQLPSTGEIINSLSGQVTGTLVDVAIGSQFNDNVNKAFGIGLSIPIFNNGQRYSMRNAKLNLAISKASLDQVKNTLRQTVFQAHTDAKASYNSYLAANKSVEASQESFKYAQERYKVGALNQFDYENAKNNLAVAVSQRARAKYDYIFKIKVLEFYLTNQVSL